MKGIIKHGNIEHCERFDEESCSSSSSNQVFCLAVTFGELWKFEQYDTMCLQKAMKALQVVKI